MAPLPNEKLLRVSEFAVRANVTPHTAYDYIRNGKLRTVVIGGMKLIPESEADRFIRDWPSKNRGVSARWAEYRAWKAQQNAGEAA